MSNSPIFIADTNWFSGSVQANIMKTILEDGYGLQVELVPGSTMPSFNALESGTLDIIPELWYGSLSDRIVEDGEVILVGDGLEAAEGFFIDKNTAEAYNISSIEDMLKPEIVALFAQDGNTPILMGCPSGWGCHTTNEALFYSMGLDAQYELAQPNSQSELDNYISSGIANSTPVFTYYWTVTALVDGLVRVTGDLDVSKNDAWNAIVSAAYEDDYVPDIDALRALDFEGYIVQPVSTVVGKSFSESHSDVTAFLNNFDMSTPTLSALNQFKDSSNLSVEQAAQYYLATNNEWQDWVTTDAVNGIQSVIDATITIADINWASASIQASILDVILEKGYGYTVSKIASDGDSAFAAMSAGLIDVVPEHWPFYSGAENENVLFVGDGMSAGEGFYIDKYTAELHNINSIEDMLKPSISSLFVDANAAVVLTKGPDSWGPTAELLYYSMGLDASYGLVSSDNAQELESVITEHLNNNTPVFTFYWEPTQLADGLIKIDPGADSSQWDVLNAASLDDSIDELHDLGVEGWPNAMVTTAVNKAFSVQNTEVTTILGNFDISSATLSALSNYLRSNNLSSEQTARYYLSNTDEWQAWVVADAVNLILTSLNVSDESVSYNLHNNGLYIEGTSNDDVIKGSVNGDVIKASLGNDTIDGGGKGNSGQWWDDLDTVEYAENLYVLNRGTGENVKAFDVVFNTDNSVSVTRLDLTGNGNNSTDTLVDIGRITFGDGDNRIEFFLDQREDVWMWDDWSGPRRALSIEGGVGNDLIQGSDQQDWLRGGEGNDIILADQSSTASSAIIAAGGGRNTRPLPEMDSASSTSFTVSLGEIKQAAFIGKNENGDITTRDLNVNLPSDSAIQFSVVGSNSSAATAALMGAADVDAFVSLVSVFRSPDLRVDLWINHNPTLNIDGTNTALQGAVLLDIFDANNFSSGDRMEGGEGNDFMDGGLSGNSTENTWENNNEARYQGKAENYQIKQISVSDSQGIETQFNDGTLISDWWAAEKPNSTDTPSTFSDLLSALGLQNVILKEDVYVLVNDQKGDEGIDILVNVQRINFSDKGIFLEPEVRVINWRGDNEPTGTEYNGTLFGDQITGTDGYDEINSKGGNDLILAGAGGDRINSGAGNDYIDAGASGSFYNNRWQDVDEVRFDGSIKRYSINQVEQAEVRAFWDTNFSADLAASLSYNSEQTYFLITDLSPTFSTGSTLLTNVDRINFEDEEVWLNTSIDAWDENRFDPLTAETIRIEGTQFNDTVIAADFMANRDAKDLWKIDFTGYGGDDVFIGDDMGSNIRDGAGNDLIVGGGSPVLVEHRWFGQDQVSFSGVKARYQIELIGSGDLVIDSNNNTIFDLTNLAGGTITTADGTVHQIGSGYNKAFVVTDLLPAEYEGQGINLLLGVERIDFNGSGINLESEIYENTWATNDDNYVREIHVRGTTFDDIINTEENSDHANLRNWVDSDEGNDYIFTGGGGDEIRPGKGNDFIDGGLSGNSGDTWQRMDKVNFDISKAGFIITQASQAQVEEFWSANFANQSFTYQASQDYYLVKDSNPVDGYGVNLITNIDRIQFNDGDVKLNYIVQGDYWDNDNKDNFRIDGSQFSDVIVSNQIKADRTVLPEDHQAEVGATIRVEMEGRGGNDVFIGDSEENQFNGGVGNDVFVGDTSNNPLNVNDEARFSNKYSRYQIETVNSGDIVYEVKGDSSSDIVYDLSQLVIGNIITADGNVYSVGNHHLSAYVVRDILSDEQGGDGIDLLLGVERMSFNDKSLRLTPEVWEDTGNSTLLGNVQLTEFDDFLDLSQGITTNEGNEVNGGHLEGKAGNDTVIGYSLGTKFKGGTGNDIFIAPAGYVATDDEWWESNEARYTGPSTRYQIDTGYLQIGDDNLPVYNAGQINWSDTYIVGYQSAFRVADQLTDTLGGEGTDYLVGVQSIQFQGDDAYFRVGTQSRQEVWNYWIESDAYRDEYGNDYGNELPNAKLVHKQEGSRFDDTLTGIAPSLPTIGDNQEISLDLGLLGGMITAADVVLFKDLQGQQVVEAVRPFASLPVGTALTAKLWMADASDATAINTTLAQEGVTASEVITALASSADQVQLIISTTDNNADLDGLFAHFFLNDEDGSFQQIVNQGMNILDGEQGNDILIGNVGPDDFVGGMGDDIIIGGGDDAYQDSARYSNSIDQYTLTSTWVLLDDSYRLIGESDTQINSNYQAATVVTDINTGADGDGRDILIGVERIEFGENNTNINIVAKHSFNLENNYYPGVNLNSDGISDFPSFRIETADIDEVLHINSITSQYSYTPYVSSTPFGFDLTTDSFRNVEASKGDDVFFGLANNTVWSTESTGDDIFEISSVSVSLNQLSFSQGYDVALDKAYVEVNHNPSFPGTTDYGTNRLYDFDQIQIKIPGSNDPIKLPLALNPSLEWTTYDWQYLRIEDSLFDDVIDDALIASYGTPPEGFKAISIDIRGGNDTVDISAGSIWMNAELVDKWRFDDGDDLINTGAGLDLYGLTQSLKEFQLTYFYDANQNKLFDEGEAISLVDFQSLGVTIYDGANPYALDGNTTIDYATYLASHSAKTIFGDSTTDMFNRDTGWFTYNDNYLVELAHAIPGDLGGRGSDVLQNMEMITINKGGGKYGVFDILTGTVYGEGYFSNSPVDYTFDASSIEGFDVGGDLTLLRTAPPASSDTNSVSLLDATTQVGFHYRPDDMNHWAIQLTYNENDKQHTTVTGTDSEITMSSDHVLYQKVGDVIAAQIAIYNDNVSLQTQATNYANGDDITFIPKDIVHLNSGDDIIDLGGDAAQDEKGAGYIQDVLVLGAPFNQFDITYGNLDANGKIPNAEFNFLSYVGTSEAIFARVSDKLDNDLGGFGVNYLFGVNWITPDGYDWTVGELSSWYVDWGGVDRLHIDGTGANEVIAPVTIETAKAAIDSNSIVGVITNPGKGDDVLIGLEHDKFADNIWKLDQVEMAPSDASFGVQRVYVGLADDRSNVARESDGSITYYDYGEAVADNFQLKEALLYTDQIVDSDGGYGTKLIIDFEQINFADRTTDYIIASEYKIEQWGDTTALSVRGTKFDDVLVIGQSEFDVLNANGGNEVSVEGKAGNDFIVIESKQYSVNAQIGAGNDYVYLGHHFGDLGENNYYNIRLNDATTRFDVQTVGVVLDDAYMPSVNEQGNWILTDVSTVGALEAVLVTDIVKTGTDYGSNLLVGFDRIDFSDGQIQMAIEEWSNSWTDDHSGIEYFDVTQRGTALGERISFKVDGDGNPMNVRNQLEGKGGNDVLIGGPTGDELRGGIGDDILIGGGNGDSGNDWRDLDRAKYEVSSLDRLTISSVKVGYNASTNALWRDSAGDIQLNPSAVQLSPNFSLTAAYQISDVVSDELGGYGTDILIGIERLGIDSSEVNLGVTTQLHDWNNDQIIDNAEVRGSQFNDIIRSSVDGGDVNDATFLDHNNDIDTKGGDDNIYAGAGGDWIRTGTGNDFVDGGSNTGKNNWGGDNQDEVRFASNQSAYELNSTIFAGVAHNIKDLEGNTVFSVQADGQIMRVSSEGNLSLLSQLATGDRYTVVQDQTPSGDLGGEGTNLLIGVEAINFQDNHLRLEQNEGKHLDENGNVQHAWLEGTALGDILIGHDYNEDIRGYAGNDVLYGGGGGDRLHGGAGNDILIGGSNGTSGDSWRDLDQADYWQYSSDRAEITSIKVGLSADGKSLLLDGSGEVLLSPTESQLGAGYTLAGAYQVHDISGAGFGTDTLIGVERLEFKGQSVNLLVTTYEDDWNQDGIIDWSEIRGTSMADRITTLAKNGVIDSIGLLNSNNYISTEAGDDDIWAMAGGDNIRPGSGNDYINGGANGMNDGSGYVRKDSVEFSGAESRYEINNFSFAGEAIDINDLEGNSVFKILDDGSVVRVNADNSHSLLDQLSSGQKVTQVTDLMPGGVLGGEGVNLMINVESLNFDGSWMGLEVERNLQYDSEGNLVNSWINGTSTGDIGLTGTLISDSINGNGGDDVLVGLQGSDHFNGGAGNDVIWGDYLNSTEILPGEDVVRFNGLQSQYSISQIEASINGTVISAIQVSDLLSADFGGTGTDTLYGIEALSFSDNWVRVGVEMYEHKDNGIVVERNFNGSIFDDNITGSDLTDNIQGGDGNDVMTGGAGGDYFEGGDGNDTIYGGTEGVDAWGNARVDVARFNGKWSDYTIQHYDSVGVKALSHDSEGYLTVQVDSDDGTGDIDTLYGIERLEFSDRQVSFSEARNFTDVNGDGIPDWAEIRGTTQNDTLNGGDIDDVLYGDDGNDTLNGNKGNDMLSGDGGSDTLDGGSGSDVFGNAFIDTAKFSGNFSDYTVVSGAGNSWTVTKGNEIDTLINIEVLAFDDMSLNLVTEVSTRDFDNNGTIDFANLTGTLDNDTFNVVDDKWTLSSNAENIDYYLDLGAGNDSATLGSGNDTIFDYLGTDNYDGGDGFDTLQLVGERSNWGTISTNENGSRTITDSDGNNSKTIRNIEQIQFKDKMVVLVSSTTELDKDSDGSVDSMLYTGTETADNISATSDLQWIINTGAGADTLYGGAGDDRLNGGSGDDILSGGDGQDTALYDSLASDATITVTKLSQSESGEITESESGVLSGFKVVIGNDVDLLLDMEVIEFSDGLVNLTGSEELLSSFSLSKGLENIRYVEGTQFGDTLASSSYEDIMTGGDGIDAFVIKEGGYNTVSIKDFVGLSDNTNAHDILRFDSDDDATLFGISVANWFSAETDIATGATQLADTDDTNDASAQKLIDDANATKLDIVSNILKTATFDTNTGDATFRFNGDHYFYMSNVTQDDLSIVNIDIV